MVLLEPLQLAVDVDTLYIWWPWQQSASWLRRLWIPPLSLPRLPNCLTRLPRCPQFQSRSHRFGQQILKCGLCRWKLSFLRAILQARKPCLTMSLQPLPLRLPWRYGIYSFLPRMTIPMTCSELSLSRGRQLQNNGACNNSWLLRNSVTRSLRNFFAACSNSLATLQDPTRTTSSCVSCFYSDFPVMFGWC